MSHPRPEVPMIVMLDQPVPAGDEDELLECLQALGTPQVCRQPDLRAASELTFLVLVHLPLTAFLASIATELGRDSYRQLVRALRRLQDRRRAAGGAAAAGLHDTGTAVLLILEPGLPDAAYQQLGELDLTRLRPGPARFRAGRWRSADG